MKYLLILFACLSVMKGYTEEFNFIKDTNNVSEQQVSKRDEIVFPCELSENPAENTKIVFYGANHTSEMDDRITMSLMTDGARGRIYVGLEGYSGNSNLALETIQGYLGLDIEQSRVFGIETEFVHTLTLLPTNYVTLYRAVHGLFGEEIRLSRYKMSFLVTIWKSPFLNELWKQIDRPFVNSEDEELALFIDELISLQHQKKQVFVRLADVQNQPMWNNNHAFLRLSKRIAEDFTSFQISGEQIEMPDLGVYTAVLENPESLSYENRFVFEIAVSWRDVFLAENITPIYCSALKERKPLFLVVGKLHVESLSSLLIQASSGRIEIMDNLRE